MPTLQELETALVNADKAGDADAARRLAVAVRDMRASSTTADQIPGAAQPQTPTPRREPSIIDRTVGAGEAGLTLGTGTVGYLAGLVAGGNEAIKALLYGATGTKPDPGLMPDPSGAFEREQQALTYIPRTEAGKEALQTVARASEALAPLPGLQGEMAMLANASRAARGVLPSPQIPAGRVAREGARVPLSEEAAIESARQWADQLFTDAYKRAGDAKRQLYSAEEGATATRRQFVPVDDIEATLRQGGRPFYADRNGNVYVGGGTKADPLRRATSAEIESAKESLSTKSADARLTMDQTYWQRFTGDADALAQEAAARGLNVRRVVPDDSNSQYLYISDPVTGAKKKVRFADHAQPNGFREDGTRGAVGGYSREQGRRHEAADISIAPGEQTLDDARALLDSLAPRRAPTGAPTPLRTVIRAATEGTARDIAGPAAAAGVSRAIDAAGTARQAVTTLPRRALAAITREEPKTPTPGTMGSAGAAATDIATQRTTTAESLGLAGEAALTKGQATRDPAQLKFEVETAKMPEEGAKLRARRVAQNEALLNEIERDIDITGSQAPTLRAVGESVDRALVGQYRADKAQVNAAYAKARKSPEASALVDQVTPITIGEGDSAITGTPIGYINSRPAGLNSTGVVDDARSYAVKLGIADMENGKLVPRPATIQQLEDWRSEISAAIDNAKDTDRRHGALLKGLIDGQTEPAAGPLFRQARGARTRLAQNYEDRASIAKLLAKKPGTQDRAVALEDVFDHAILKGSLDDVRNVRRVLQRSGQDGAQGWRELQGQTLKHIRDEATKSVAADSAGNRVISPAAMDKTIRALDHDGKLDFIFGKQGAQRLRDINDIAQVAKTVPPEAAVNFSNTASTLLTGFADLGLSTMTGVPAPLATATRLGLKHIKDKKLRARIDDALKATK